MTEFFTLFDTWSGILPIVLGVYLILLVNGSLPKNPKQPERLAEWRRKFGPMVKWGAPLGILAGVVQLAIGLSAEPVNPDAERVFAEFYRANEARVSRGTTLASAEQFLADLKVIEATEMPADLHSAFSDYVRGFDEGLKLLRASQPTTTADAKITDAKKRMDILAQKHLH